MNVGKRVEIYDTTLRDGSQGEGITFSVADKLALTRELDSLGVDYIEGGWPGSNPKDIDYFAAVRKLRLQKAQVTAFGSTRHARNTPGTDPNLQKIVAAKTGVVTLFGKAWDLHVRDALRVSLSKNLDMISSSVKYMTKKTGEVLFDAEHFFDGYAANPAYALKALTAAAEAGAGGLILCDTNGGNLPNDIAEITSRVIKMFPGLRVGIHTHNDAGMAVANSIAAVQAGARHVQGTMNGIGERAGNADLAQVIPVVELKLGLKSVGRRKLRRLTEVSRFVYETANMALQDTQPFVGRSAFAHKGGIHVSAVLRNPTTYETVEPEAVGNERRVLVSELSGKSNLAARSKLLRANPEKMELVLSRIMALENEGYSFENADASFELLVLKALGRYQSQFELTAFRVMSEFQEHGRRLSEATVKVKVGEEEYHTVSEGDHGPVSALDGALRKALVSRYPVLKHLRLVDYKVHIVNPQAAAEARVRVVIESANHRAVWSTVGVSANIIEASCLALVDSIEYMIYRDGQKRRKR